MLVVNRSLTNLIRQFVAYLCNQQIKKCAAPDCKDVLIEGDVVRVVPIRSAHDPRNWGEHPTAPPIREDLYHPICAERWGLILGYVKKPIWFPLKGPVPVGYIDHFKEGSK